MSTPVKLRFRVDIGNGCSVGIGKIDLLERIEQMGSLSQAARSLGMSYRRAWLLLSDLNGSFVQPVAETMTGGPGGGGARITDFGHRLIAGYRALESRLQPLADECLEELRRKVRIERSTGGLAVRSKPLARKRRAVAG